MTAYVLFERIFFYLCPHARFFQSFCSFFLGCSFSCPLWFLLIFFNDWFWSWNLFVFNYCNIFASFFFFRGFSFCLWFYCWYSCLSRKARRSFFDIHKIAYVFHWNCVILHEFFLFKRIWYQFEHRRCVVLWFQRFFKCAFWFFFGNYKPFVLLYDVCHHFYLF